MYLANWSMKIKLENWSKQIHPDYLRASEESMLRVIPKDEGDSFEIKVGAEKIRGQWSKDRSQWVEVTCSCDGFGERGCIHLAAGLKEIVADEHSLMDRITEEQKIPNIQTVIRRADGAQLKQFISGYVKYNPELNTALKLLLGTDEPEAASVDELHRLLQQLWRKNRRHIKQKKGRKKLEFFLLSCIGLAEDVLSASNYKQSAAYSIALHRWMVEVSESLYDQAWARRLHRQLIQHFDNLCRSDIAPALRDQIIEMTLGDLSENAVYPYNLDDILSQFYALGFIEKERLVKYLDEIMWAAEDWKLWLPHFLHHFNVMPDKSKRHIAQRLEVLEAAVWMDELRRYDMELADEALIFILISVGRWNSLDREHFPGFVVESQRFLTDMHFSKPEDTHGFWRTTLKEKSWTKEDRSLVTKYRNQADLSRVSEYLIDRYIFERDNTLPTGEGWEQIQLLELLPYLDKKEQQKILSQLESYCLQYAEDHVGKKGRHHLQEMGLALVRAGFESRWNKIQTSLQQQFGYRKSYRNLDRPDI